MAVHLVTGGAGFIGSHIVEALIQRGDKVRVFDNFSTGRRENLALLQSNFASAEIDVIEGDVRDVDAVRAAVSGAEYLIHQAAIVSVPLSLIDPVTTHDVNVTGTLNLLRAAHEAGVRCFVLASSCAVYGDNGELPLKESSAVKPLSPYAASKLAAEVYCQMFHRAYGLPTVCLRYFNVYGPRQNPNGDYAAVIPRFAQRLRAGQPPIIFGDGHQTRDFVHISDVVRANLLACDRVEAAGRVLNVAGGRGVSLLELVAILNELCNTHFTPRFEPARAGDVPHSRGDGTQLNLVLGFQPVISLMAGLQQILS